MIRISIFLLGFFLAAPQVGSTPTVVRNFPANTGPGWKQSIDIAGAVGPRHVVGFDVAAFVVHDKDGGDVLRRMPPRGFWRQVEPAGTLVPEKESNDAASSTTLYRNAGSPAPQGPPDPTAS